MLVLNILQIIDVKLADNVWTYLFNLFNEGMVRCLLLSCYLAQ